MTVDEITKEREFTERRINEAMREFIARTGLAERQVKASWDRCMLSAYANTPPEHGSPVWTAFVTVTL